MKKNQRNGNIQRGIIRTLLTVLLLLSLTVSGLAEGMEAISLGTLISDHRTWEIQYRPLDVSYELQLILTREDAIIADLNIEDTSLPWMNLSIVRSERWADAKQLSDLSRKDLQAIQEAYLVENEEPAFEDAKTSDGAALLVVRTAGGKDAFVYTILHGFEIELRLFAGTTETEISEEDLQRGISVIDGLEFIGEQAE